MGVITYTCQIIYYNCQHNHTCNYKCNFDKACSMRRDLHLPPAQNMDTLILYIIFFTQNSCTFKLMLSSYHPQAYKSWIKAMYSGQKLRHTWNTLTSHIIANPVIFIGRSQVWLVIPFWRFSFNLIFLNKVIVNQKAKAGQTFTPSSILMVSNYRALIIIIHNIISWLLYTQ